MSGTDPTADTPTHAETLDRALRLLARSRRALDWLADEIQNAKPLTLLHAGIAEDLAGEIVALIGHSVTDQPEADEMFALREFLGESDCSGCSMLGGRHWDTCPNRGDGRPTR